ncbi:MAG TPA: enoyl-CoA hydratase/isomerase family protein [Actinomycetes bacterium]|nr:enoyl-CoA hydratase/isomerase family protein [Actinomycetes bacterium]
MTDQRERPVLLEVAGHLATVTLHRPDALNAISTAMAAALADVFGSLGGDRRVRAVVLAASGGRAFCAGADLRERHGFGDEDWLAQREVFRRAFAAVRRCPLPTVAAVGGVAFGGGAELALSCDLVVAAEDARFALPEVGLGLVPGGGGTQLLARRAGRGVARDLILTGRRIDAEEALRLGVADRLVPAGKALAGALELAGELATRSPAALRLAKRAIEEGADLPLEDGIGVEDRAWREAAMGPDRREGVAAWNERREPHWPEP